MSGLPTSVVSIQRFFFSGYRIKIQHREESEYAGRLHVDFATARDDQHEYECRMKTMTPPTVVKFTEKRAKAIVKQLRDGKITFKEVCRVIIAWLKRGSCNWHNSPTFFSLMQSLTSSVYRSESELIKAGEELQEAKDKFVEKRIEIGTLFNDAEMVFGCASMQNVMQNFTKAQRVKLDLWKKKVALLKHSALVESRIEADMEISDDEEGSEKEDVNKLRDELQACKKKLEESEKVGHIMQLKYLETKKKLEDAKSESSGSQANGFSNKSIQTNDEGLLNSCAESLSDMEARLLILISTFLYIHPLGASIEYICAYLETMQSNINIRDIENLMRKFGSIFKEETTGIGVNLVKKWKYLNFLTDCC